MNKKKINVKNKEYTLNEIVLNYKNNEFRIPKYQRKYEWTPKMRDYLVDSILKGYPIGNIIIWEHADSKYILDGQQRTRSLLKIRKHPFRDLSKETFLLLFPSGLSKGEQQILTEILKELSDKPIEALYISPDGEETENNTIEKIVNRKKLISNKRGISDEEIIYFLKKYVSDLYIGSKIRIPSINISNSSEEDAIEIFERLNSKGISLTKMEKLAARWSTNILNINDPDLQKLIKNIYELDESENIRDINENTPSELIWVLLLNSFKGTNFFKALFTEDIDETTYLKNKHIDKLLWLIRVAIVRYKENSVKDRLFDDFENDIKIGSKISDIIKSDEKWVLNIGELLNKTWKLIEDKCPILKMQKEHDGEYIFIEAASTNLFISMASQVLNELIDDKEYIISNNIQLNLLKEIIAGTYLSSTNKVVKKTIENKEYLEEISIFDLEKQLIDANNTQKREPRAKNGFNNLVKLVISISHSENSNNMVESFSFDHVFPKKYLNENDLPKGQHSIGNCGLLISRQNRKNQDSLIIEDFLNDKLHKIPEVNIEIEEYKYRIKRILKDQKYRDFEDFLDYRFEIILKLFLEKVK